MNHAFWVHLAMALGATTVAAPNAAAQPPDGTISSFTGNLASSACVNPEGLTVDHRGNFYVGIGLHEANGRHLPVHEPRGARQSHSHPGGRQRPGFVARYPL